MFHNYNGGNSLNLLYMIHLLPNTGKITHKEMIKLSMNYETYVTRIFHLETFYFPEKTYLESWFLFEHWRLGTEWNKHKLKNTHRFLRTYLSYVVEHWDNRVTQRRSTTRNSWSNYFVTHRCPVGILTLEICKGSSRQLRHFWVT